MKKIYFTAILAMVGLLAWSQTDTTQLRAIVIVAPPTSNQLSLDEPNAQVQLSPIELKRATGLYLTDAINTSAPGVFMQNRTFSGGQQINIRGYGNGMGIRGVNSNFDSQGLKMYLNGIPITDAEGVTVMDDIDYSLISNVEILKGPQGSMYGLAIAGVVNLNTASAKESPSFISQSVMAGSYGMLRTTSTIGIRGNQSSLLINYGHQEFDGFMKHTAAHKNFVNMIGSYTLSDRHTLSTYFGFSDSYDQRNGELTIGQYNTLDYSGNAAYIKNDAHTAVRTFRAGVNHDYKIREWLSNSTSVFGSAQNMDNSSAGGWTDRSPLNYGLRSVFNLKFYINNLTLKGNVGTEMQKMNVQTVGYRMAADSTNLGGYNTITDIRSNQVGVNRTSTYFTNWTLYLPANYSVTAGVGVSNMSIKLDDRLWASANNHPGNTKLKTYQTEYNHLVSPSASLLKKFSNKVSAYVSYSVAYKAPVASNILISTTGQLNTELKPEKGTQIEIGTKGNLMRGRLYYNIALFNAKFEDKFTTHTVQNPSNTATLYSYITNGGSLNNTGLEALISYMIPVDNGKIIKSLKPFANVTVSDFKYENFQYEKVGKDSNNQDITIVEDYSGKAVAGVAPLVYNLGVDAETKIGLYANVTYNYRSEMYFTSDGTNETAPYALLNAKLGFRKKIKLFEVEVYGGANNITSEQYYYMVFINQLPDAYIPAPNEINYFGGASLKYTF